MNLNEDLRGGTMCSSKAGLAIGGTATGVSIASPNGAAVDYAISGFFYSKPDQATVAITPAATQPLLTKCLYVVCLDAAGTLSTVKGKDVLVSDLVNGIRVLEWPDIPTNKCPIGAVKISLANAATFTAGTTALNATDVTATYYDLMTLPASPLTS